jgi:two-component system, OmpR family, response regulator
VSILETSVRVLVVEDDRSVAEVVRRGLEHSGFAVDVTPSGRDSLWYSSEFRYDVLVLDLNLPDIDGLEVCRELREKGSPTPMLMLSSRQGVADRVQGLDVGADDYLAKPFALPEVVARVRALARRNPTPPEVTIEVGDTVLDTGTRRVTRACRSIELTAKEFALLHALMRRPGTVMTADQLLEAAWDFAYEPQSNVVAVYVRYLRNKLDRPFGRSSIATVRGHGYRYDPTG